MALTLRGMKRPACPFQMDLPLPRRPNDHPFFPNFIIIRLSFEETYCREFSQEAEGTASLPKFANHFYQEEKAAKKGSRNGRQSKNRNHASGSKASACAANGGATARAGTRQATGESKRTMEGCEFDFP
jgi:hypothetical protein